MDDDDSSDYNHGIPTPPGETVANSNELNDGDQAYVAQPDDHQPICVRSVDQSMEDDDDGPDFLMRAQQAKCQTQARSLAGGDADDDGIDTYDYPEYQHKIPRQAHSKKLLEIYARKGKVRVV